MYPYVFLPVYCVLIVVCVGSVAVAIRVSSGFAGKSEGKAMENARYEVEGQRRHLSAPIVFQLV